MSNLLQLDARVESGYATAQIFIINLRKAGRSEGRGKGLLVGKLSNGLDQILIGVSLSGQHRTERRNDLEGPGGVQATQ